MPFTAHPLASRAAKPPQAAASDPTQSHENTQIQDDLRADPQPRELVQPTAALKLEDGRTAVVSSEVLIRASLPNPYEGTGTVAERLAGLGRMIQGRHALLRRNGSRLFVAEVRHTEVRIPIPTSEAIAECESMIAHGTEDEDTLALIEELLHFGPAETRQQGRRLEAMAIEMRSNRAGGPRMADALEDLPGLDNAYRKARDIMVAEHLCPA